MIPLQNTNEKRQVNNIRFTPSTTECPMCAEQLTFSKPLSMNQFIQCPDCKTMLYVASVHPLALEWLEVIEEEAAGPNAKESLIPSRGRRNFREKPSARHKDIYNDDDSDQWENRRFTKKRRKSQGRTSHRRGQKQY